jgi:ankyrin repeat protein
MQPIHIAAACGHLEMLKFLANFPGIDVNEPNLVVRFPVRLLSLTLL